MNIEFIELKLRNFLSFGNVVQSVKLNKDACTLITGLNKDKSTEDESEKNGVGKTSVFTAIHYAIFGRAIGGKVTLPNLVNNINKKNMEVVLTFRKDDTLYKIERGRNPTYLRFYKEDEEIADESLGDSRDTQNVIENVIGMSEELFNQTILLSRGVPIFMDQTLANQKLIIEKVLGIDIITKKIEALKALIKETKGELANEEFKIQTVNTQAETMVGNYKAQLDNLERQSKEWAENRETQLKEKKALVEQADSIDYNRQYNILKAWEQYDRDNMLSISKKEEYDKLVVEQKSLNDKIIEATKSLNEYNNIDIDWNKEAFEYNAKIDELYKDYQNLMTQKDAVKKNYDELCAAQKKIDDEIKKLDDEKKAFTRSVCPTCGQEIGKEQADTMIIAIDNRIKELQDGSHKLEMEILDVNSHLQSDFNKYDNQNWCQKETQVKTLQELFEIDNRKQSLQKDLEVYKSKLNDVEQKLKETPSVNELKQPDEVSCFKTEQEMFEFKAKVEAVKNEIKLLEAGTDPYKQSIEDVKKSIEGIKYADSSILKELENKQTHNEILLKLLNSPSSYIRQAILDKSLEFLNQRIKHYLVKLGSQHYVKFNNDMSLDISKDGIEFGYISSGETGRVSMALTFAFRDAYESLSGNHYNLLMVDELIDSSGLDDAGKMDLLKCLLEETNRNTFIVSHDPIISTQITNKMIIVKENSFSNIGL